MSNPFYNENDEEDNFKNVPSDIKKVFENNQ